MTKVKLTKQDIESSFFEYKKLEAMLQHRVGIELSNYQFAPNNVVQDFVNSRLLIDLLSIVDNAVGVMFDFYGYPASGKSKLAILFENNKVYNHPYLKWYKEWRNEVAHDFRKIEFHLLRQASDEIQHQLLEWQLISGKYDVSPYEVKVDDKTYHYGSIINDIPILLYRITYRDGDGKTKGAGCNWEELVNLTLDEYLIGKSKLGIKETNGH